MTIIRHAGLPVLACLLLIIGFMPPAAAQGRFLVRPDHNPYVIPVIVRGTTAGASVKKFTVAIRYVLNRQAMCTGVLVAQNWVLTADHCVERVDKIPRTSMYVAFNAVYSAADRYTISKYVPFTSHDVAMIKLDRDAAAPAAPIAIDSGPIFNDKDAQGAGWGLTLRDGSAEFLSKQLLMIDTPLRNEIQGGLCYDDEFLCGYFTNQSAGPTSADSGGPLFYNDAGDVKRLVGIFNKFEQYQHPLTGAPLLIMKYTRASVFGDWVRQTINAN
ncbi:trypsin-like serine protease [Ferrovibrio sp.]|uniref:trypsin-like serine protease n=1 Tax=Ferrovibrio sp. TaxID=1917215 RepID=UPI003512D1D3